MSFGVSLRHSATNGRPGRGSAAAGGVVAKACAAPVTAPQAPQAPQAPASPSRAPQAPAATAVSTQPAISIENLHKRYRNGRGIHGVSLSVEAGEICGFLGPNGAGKSTTIRTLMGFMTPDSGRASILGLDTVRDSLAVRRKVGYVPGDFSLYEGLSGEENIAFSLGIRGQPQHMGEARRLAERLEVDLARRVRTLSHGQKQKVAIVAALAHRPEVLILDEPTTGLDPLAQDAFRTLLREQVARGGTVFLSSHVLSEVEELCDRVAIINEGRIVAIDTVAGLKKKRVKRILVEFRDAAPSVEGIPGVAEVQRDGNRVRFTLTGSLDPLVAFLAGKPLVDLTVEDPSLEEVFMAFYRDRHDRPGGGTA